MRTRLAWHNLAHFKVRTAAAVAGVTFAVVLIFLQLGFRFTAEKTASMVYEALDFDILLRSSHTRRLVESRPFPELRLYQAASVEGAGEAAGLLLGARRWLSPGGAARPIMVIGVHPNKRTFAPGELGGKVALLSAPEYVLVDRASRSEFGPRNGRRFGDEDIGTEPELEFRRVRIVGHFFLGTSFDADGMVVISEEGFRRVSPQWPADYITLGLIRVAPGSDADSVARQVRQSFQDQGVADVEVFSRQQVIAQERWIWLWQMSIGLIFTMGVAVALVVGGVIVYHVLSSDVASHLPEYATLKAMGYSHGALARVVLEQAVILALLGFMPGLAIAELLYALTVWQTRLPIEMTALRIVGVLGLAVAMCMISGMIALGKLRQADPADLY